MAFFFLNEVDCSERKNNRKNSDNKFIKSVKNKQVIITVYDIKLCLFVCFLFQALQSKHDALLKRVDELDNECEELRDRVLETEGERDELQGVMEDLQTETKNLSEELDNKQVFMTRFCLLLVLL